MMNLARNSVVKLYYKYELTLLKNLNGLYPVFFLILKTSQRSEPVDMISVHFPPPSRFLSPDNVELILSQSWLMFPLLETLFLSSRWYHGCSFSSLRIYLTQRSPLQSDLLLQIPLLK